MEPNSRRLPQPGRHRGRRSAAIVLAFALAATSCSSERDDPISPNAPPRPTVTHGTPLMHAHFRLPARPAPFAPGMM